MKRKLSWQNCVEEADTSHVSWAPKLLHPAQACALGMKMERAWLPARRALFKGKKGKTPSCFSPLARQLLAPTPGFLQLMPISILDADQA